MAFFANEGHALNHLKSRFPKSYYKRVADKIQQDALFIFQHDWSKLNQIKLHLNGTPFQIKVWETLLKIPTGNLSTYGNIAREIEHP